MVVFSVLFGKADGKTQVIAYAIAWIIWLLKPVWELSVGHLLATGPLTASLRVPGVPTQVLPMLDKPLEHGVDSVDI